MLNINSHSVSSVAQSCPTPCDPMNRSTPGLPVRHQLPHTVYLIMTLWMITVANLKFVFCQLFK